MNGPLLSKGGQVYYGELDKEEIIFLLLQSLWGVINISKWPKNRLH